jgi:uncharacterized membrane protein
MRRMPTRVRGIDVVRGLVMVLMAVDHVRVFAGVPAGGPTPAVFFTRWITHFCAPGFLFLAGTSAYLRAAAAQRPRANSRQLLTRGLFLVLLELTVLRLAWTFNGDVWNYNLAGVIWLIGWCMVALAALVRLPRWALATFGLAIVLGHNAAGPVMFGEGRPIDGWVAQVLYTAGDFRVWDDGPRLVILYTLLPWIGVMALGYVFGAVVARDQGTRDRWCTRLGVVAILAFVLLRTFNVYGDPRPWNPAPPGAVSAWAPVLSFLNTAKYPASLDYLLMTLGPLLLAMPWLSRTRGRIADALELFGRVPLFYYLLHIPLIHLAALAISLVRTGTVSPWLFANHPMEPGPPPPEAVWSLPLLYAVTAGVVLVLLPACRWYARVKRQRRHPLLALI